MRHQFATVHELARIQLLSTLPGETLGVLAERMERRALAPGEVIMEGADEHGRFTVVLSGMLRTGSGRILRPGDTLGGLTVFGESVRAMTPSAVAWCDQATFDELLRPLLGSSG
jgi:CRP-like cAMP-binding protein